MKTLIGTFNAGESVVCCQSGHKAKITILKVMSPYIGGCVDVLFRRQTA